MKRIPIYLLLGLWLCGAAGCSDIDREALVRRHDVVTTRTDPKSPAQVGNGEFAFGVDITGLQTFVPFNTIAQWGWHSFPLADSLIGVPFEGVVWDTHGRPVRYDMPNETQPELSQWLAGNPHRINLGRIGFVLKKKDGTEVREIDLQHSEQRVDLYHGTIYSRFEIEGTPVEVETACHPERDMVAVRVKSRLIRSGQLYVRFDFPYADGAAYTDYVGDWSHPEAHKTEVVAQAEHRVDLSRTMDSTRYYVSVGWSGRGEFVSKDTVSSPHRFYLVLKQESFGFVCAFSSERTETRLPTAARTLAFSRKCWVDFWRSGAAIDLSESRDPRWKELERRIVLSQYLMRVNASGTLPPQESGLVNNGWYGRFHFEMIWWHLVHNGLWNRWPLAERSLKVYSDFLPTSKQRAAEQGYRGARWPKCTANFDREWPHPIHALLIWQQPHPIYFAELNYRLYPSEETLLKWKDIVIETADFMADYAHFDSTAGRYVLGPPMYIVSENTDPKTTINPTFELGYWRFGLRTALDWLDRLEMEPNEKWRDVLHRLAPLPQRDSLYETYEGIDRMWEQYAFEHPALIGVLGMLPGDGVDTTVLNRTLDKVVATWNFDRTWGWDFPMLAMAAARTGRPELAVEMLLYDAPGFQFDAHGLATGGPFPYMPSNGALLTAVAMMVGGWDGSGDDEAPGFPDNGLWKVRCEGFQRMP